MNHINQTNITTTVVPLGGEFTFCPALNEMLLAGKIVGRSGKQFGDIGALSSLNNLRILRELHLRFRPGRTLEIGLCFGGSGLLFTATHQELSGQPKRQHTALDPFQKETWDDAGLLAIERAGLSDYLDFHPQFSSLVLPRLVEKGEQFGLVYVDGSHIFEDVFVDAYFGSRLLAEQGIIAFDDCRDLHVLKVIKFIRTNLKSSLQELDLSPFRADKGKSLKYRLARLAGQVQMNAFQRVGDFPRSWNASFSNF